MCFTLKAICFDSVGTMAEFQQRMHLALLLLALWPPGVRSTHESWYEGNVTAYGSNFGSWEGTGCVYFPDRAPSCGWIMEFSFSKNMLYVSALKGKLHYIGSPTNYYQFKNSGNNTDLSNKVQPFCLDLVGSFDSSAQDLTFTARMHCVCLEG